jgi:RND family efflux transporter MFP subunit
MKTANAITNRYQDFHVLNLSRLLHQVESRGPFMVTQDGSDPEDHTMRACSFVLTRRGTWLHFYRYLALSEAARARIAHFDTVAETLRRTDSLPDRVVVEDDASLQEMLREAGLETEMKECNPAANAPATRTDPAGFEPKQPVSIVGKTGLLLGLVAALFTGCRDHGAPPPGRVDLPPAIVRVETVGLRLRTATEEVVGTVRSRQLARLEAKLAGRIGQVMAVPGQSVKTGEVLVRLEAREIHAKLNQALAVQQQAGAELRRYKALLETGAVARSEFDAVQARARVADAAVEEAQTMLGYVEVIAPFDGVVTRKLAEVGDLATPGRALLELENPAALRLETDVPEALLANLKLGDRLPVHIAALKAELSGSISEIAPAADAGSRTFLVKLDLPATPGLRSGQFGRVAIPVAEVNALRVPASAVVVRGQMELVFVVAGQQAQMRLVKTGKRLGSEIEIVSGVNSGETLVVEGANALTDGQPLQVKP